LQIGNTVQRGKAATNCEKWHGFPRLGGHLLKTLVAKSGVNAELHAYASLIQSAWKILAK
jgi:hypothetical protein